LLLRTNSPVGGSDQASLIVLFAGKTTLLRYLLENSGLKIGCVVNDVASVNIDAKLIRNDRSREKNNGLNTTSDLADTIELANGCACKLTTSLIVACAGGNAFVAHDEALPRA